MKTRFATLILIITCATARILASETGTTVTAEAEDAMRLESTDIVTRADASGGKAIRWKDGAPAAGRAEYEVTLPHAGTWYLWLRTQAIDHLTNGLFVELDGLRLSAPSGHPQAPTDIVYLRKHPTLYAWCPEWQGAGHGNHAGPIAFTVAEPGRHVLALVARGNERPIIDKITLTRSANPAFLREVEHVGPVRLPPLPGQLVVHPKNPARFGRVGTAGQIEDVMLCGLGSPEGLLYLPAVEQDAIVSEVIRHGGNMLYVMAVRSHGGDGGPTENPFIDNDPTKTLDETILVKWADLFRRVEQAGIYIFFIVYDDGCDPFGKPHLEDVPLDETAFFQAIVHRFRNHPNLVWCVAEEYGDALTAARAAALASIIAENDPHQRPVSVHHATGDTSFDFASEKAVTVLALQPQADSAERLHAEVLAAIRNTDGHAIVHMAENWNNRVTDLRIKGDHPGCVAQGDRAGVRQRNWAVAMAGATCQVLGPWERSSGNAPATPEMLADMRRLVDFFAGVPLHALSSKDPLAHGDALWVLASEDDTMAVAYANSSTDNLGIAFRSGRYAARWMDCATGAAVETQVQTTGHSLRLARPPGIGAECAVFVVPYHNSSHPSHPSRPAFHRTHEYVPNASRRRPRLPPGRRSGPRRKPPHLNRLFGRPLRPHLAR